jgi:hypothetical protein
MDRMETADRAQRLRNLQGYGSERTENRDISTDEINDLVKRVLARRAGALPSGGSHTTEASCDD